MSYDTGMTFWVGDLDGYVTIMDPTPHEDKDDLWIRGLEAELAGLGDVSLFSNKTISSFTLRAHGVDSAQWRWKIHRAETALGHLDTHEDIESAFLKATMSLVRRYAVARYATFEDISFSSAITAIFPHGIRALLFSYMAGQPSLSESSCRKEIQQTLNHATSMRNLTAYDRAGVVRDCLYKLAITKEGKDGGLKLDKSQTRTILSLLRLYFSILECQVRSVAELREIHLRYEAARAAEKQGFDTSRKVTGKKIQNWRLRSLQPLTFYFPYSVRDSLKRLIDQDTSGERLIDHKSAVNELALIYCEIERMWARGKEKAKQIG
jgi:hypothetical protein